MKKVFRKIHLWLSLPLGIIITLVCFSGAMLVFEPEVAQWLNPSLHYVPAVGERPLPLDELAEQAAATLPQGVEVQGITTYPDPERAYQVALSKPRRASLYIDQYTGQVLGRYERPAFFAAMFRLHRWLLDSRPGGDGVFWGKLVVGISTIVFVIVLVTGVVIWWPRTARALRESLKIRRRHFWHGLHVAGGMYALVLLLAMALTGLTWSFGWYRTGFYAMFGIEMVQGQEHGKADRKEQHKGEKFQHWQAVYERLAAENADCISITVGDGQATVANNHYGNTRGSDRYTFDRRTGHITAHTPYDQLPPSGKMRGWIYSVHTGTFGGMPTRIVWFLAALLGATLPLTGYYLWLRRLVSHG